MRGTLLEICTWRDAESLLTPEQVIVLPLGAQLKEHGPHLPLNTDWLTAEWFRARVAERAEVVLLPTLGAHFYPAFVDYPGSVTLSFETSTHLVIEICKSIMRFGPKRFYVLNTGVSTRKPLEAASLALATEGAMMRFTDISTAGKHVIETLEQQSFGTHADEIETSMLLAIAPDQVNMTLACQDGHAGTGPLRRTAGLPGILSPSGVFGDARRASREKGEKILAAMLEDIMRDIEALRALPDES